MCCTSAKYDATRQNVQCSTQDICVYLLKRPFSRAIKSGFWVCQVAKTIQAIEAQLRLSEKTKTAERAKGGGRGLVKDLEFRPLEVGTWLPIARFCRCGKSVSGFRRKKHPSTSFQRDQVQDGR